MSDARYTTILYEVVEDYNYNLFEFDYELPSCADKQKLELLFYKHYYFREIGAETIDRWLLQLRFKWDWLCTLYYRKFEIFNVELMKDDLFNNQDIEAINNQIFNDTPKSKLDTGSDYATAITHTTNTNKGYSGGRSKYELIVDYADKLRNIYIEMIEDCEPLFMQLL